jgi:hypothetical protein
VPDPARHANAKALRDDSVLNSIARWVRTARCVFILWIWVLDARQRARWLDPSCFHFLSVLSLLD